MWRIRGARRKDSVIAEPIPESLADSAGFLLNRTSRILQELNEEALGSAEASSSGVGTFENFRR